MTEDLNCSGFLIACVKINPSVIQWDDFNLKSVRKSTNKNTNLVRLSAILRLEYFVIPCYANYAPVIGKKEFEALQPID